MDKSGTVLQERPLLSRLHVPEPDAQVPARGSELFPVWRKGHGGDLVCMLERQALVPAGCVHDLNSPVRITQSKGSPVRRDRQGEETSAIARQKVSFSIAHIP